ncbi:MAG TPA: Fe-S protein assembly co-chaperone HscB [Gammaproteobacteria bacterium]|nr:Fe-S protein assembly co-chaperone HscB [Gammaproteobacteria bacterium]
MAMAADVAFDCFALFELPARFALDCAVLEASYLAQQRQLHPDRHVRAAPAQQHAALAATARLNTAYRTLAEPRARAVHLLALRGVDAFAADAAVPAAVLARQLDWHEALETASEPADPPRLAALAAELHAARESLLAQLAGALDEQADDAAAAAAIRQLGFVQRLHEQARAALLAGQSA